MCDEDAIQTAEANARFQDLSLGPFSTINQEAMIAVGDDL
jgi:hypothetical protein